MWLNLKLAIARRFWWPPARKRRHESDLKHAELFRQDALEMERHLRKQGASEAAIWDYCWNVGHPKCSLLRIFWYWLLVDFTLVRILWLARKQKKDAAR
jgi:hypothetical protein